ncbi:MAG TPA: shikimate dehydrogenase [Dehalococcoidia bacterium]|nr:shikimate dehydrogenase [Dehalococcoidia bacterium]
MSQRVGLIGHPVGHSISPRFQQAGFDAIGFDARYEAWDVAPEDLQGHIDSLRADALGANVTIPYKEATARHVDSLHQTARFVGAINTIVQLDGLLEGYNTDVTGFQRSLEAEGFEPAGKHAVIWGAGGAARAVAWALIWRQVDAITIVNRTGVRAGRLRHDLASASASDDVRLRATAIDSEGAPAALAACDLVVNCTPVGLRGSETESQMPFEVAQLQAEVQVVDLIANPLQTPLVLAAKARGLAAVGGLPMLVYQGAASFELWTRQAAPVDIMFAAAEAAMRQPD